MQHGCNEPPRRKRLLVGCALTRGNLVECTSLRVKAALTPQTCPESVRRDHRLWKSRMESLSVEDWESDVASGGGNC